MPQAPRIVFSGGPSGGKSTALAQTKRWLSDRGFTPFLVPEAATLLINAGIKPTQEDFQKLVFDFSINQERIFCAAAADPAVVDPVLIFDRGLMDQLAYMEATAFQTLLAEYNLNTATARDERYEGVICLQSAAIDAEQFYTLENNPARSETLERARALDEQTVSAWVGHPHLQLIANRDCTSFEEKMHKAVRQVAHILGVPEPIERERKFLIKSINASALPLSAVTVDIVQTYLVTDKEGEERVRARGQNDQWIFFHTIKGPPVNGARAERERIISREEYADLLIRRKAGADQVHKRRTCFLWENQYFELDEFLDKLKGIFLLEIELTEEQQDILLPPFLEIEKEVTDDPSFSNARLAWAS